MRDAKRPIDGSTRDDRQRAAWSQPRLSRMHAGEAEFGANPASSDGPYGGS